MSPTNLVMSATFAPNSVSKKITSVAVWLSAELITSQTEEL